MKNCAQIGYSLGNCKIFNHVSECTINLWHLNKFKLKLKQEIVKKYLIMLMISVGDATC